MIILRPASDPRFKELLKRQSRLSVIRKKDGKPQKVTPKHQQQRFP